MTEEKTYYSKLLLFGEYSVICDSMGLTVPLRRFSAHWKFANAVELSENILDQSDELLGFYHFLQETKKMGKLLPDLDLDRFKADLDKGMYFDSDIPQGFGVGSSGALCAAVYEQYVAQPIHVTDGDEKLIVELKEQLAQMESHFHGVSSGLDPLLCYLQRPLLIKNKQEIAFAGMSEELHYADFDMFLIDTGVIGKTEPLVTRFFDQCRHHSFYSRFNKELIPANNNCIQAMEDGDVNRLFHHLPVLSEFFYEHFTPMIPVDFQKIWQHGLSTGDFYLKLCGSGGGGFLLGFSKKLTAAQKYFKAAGIEIILL